MQDNSLEILNAHLAALQADPQSGDSLARLNSGIAGYINLIRGDPEQLTTFPGLLPFLAKAMPFLSLDKQKTQHLHSAVESCVPEDAVNASYMHLLMGELHLKAKEMGAARGVFILVDAPEVKLILSEQLDGLVGCLAIGDGSYDQFEAIADGLDPEGLPEDRAARLWLMKAYLNLDREMMKADVNKADLKQALDAFSHVKGEPSAVALPLYERFVERATTIFFQSLHSRVANFLGVVPVSMVINHPTVVMLADCLGGNPAQEAPAKT